PEACQIAPRRHRSMTSSTATRTEARASPLGFRTTGKRFAQALGELAHVVLVGLIAALGGTLAGSLPRVGVGQALALRALERRLVDQDALPLRSTARPAEPHHHRLKRGVLAGPPGQRGITHDLVIELSPAHSIQ